MNVSKKQILEFAQTNQKVNASSLASAYGMKAVTARQYLYSLAKDKELVRVGQGEYAINMKQSFTYKPTEIVKKISLVSLKII